MHDWHLWIDAVHYSTTALGHINIHSAVETVTENLEVALELTHDRPTAHLVAEITGHIHDQRKEFVELRKTAPEVESEKEPSQQVPQDDQVEATLSPSRAHQAPMESAPELDTSVSDVAVPGDDLNALPPEPLLSLDDVRVPGDKQEEASELVDWATSRRSIHEEPLPELALEFEAKDASTGQQAVSPAPTLHDDQGPQL